MGKESIGFLDLMPQRERAYHSHVTHCHELWSIQRIKTPKVILNRLLKIHLLYNMQHLSHVLVRHSMVRAALRVDHPHDRLMQLVIANLTVARKEIICASQVMIKVIYFNRGVETSLSCIPWSFNVRCL